MSIYKYCAFCYTSFGLDVKTCPKCKKTVEKKHQKYRVDIMVKGRRVTRVVSNLGTAREIEAKVKVDVIQDQFFDRRSEMTLGGVWDKYRAAKADLPRTRVYKGCYETWFSRWSGRGLRTIEPHEIEMLVNELRHTKTKRGGLYNEATIKSIITLLTTLFNYARKVLRQKIDNPCNYVDKPRETSEPVTPLNAGQKKALIETLDAYEDVQIGNLIRFIMVTGCRRGEVFKLLWSDVDMEGRRLVIRLAKSGRNEVIPLSETALTILEYQRAHYPGEIVFASPVTGKKYNNIDRSWRSIKIAAGIPAATTIHMLRHQFASDLVNSGASLYIVGKLLRHSNPKMTKIYAHLIDDTLREAIKRIE